MITFFNRKEIFTTFSLEKQANIRDLLTMNNINYTFRVVNASSPSPFGGTQTRLGRMGENSTVSNQYTFYVHHDDFEKATAAINGHLRH